MLASLKSEFRKLLTVRSTYVLTGLMVLLIGLVAFFLKGWHLNPMQLKDPTQLAGDVTGALNVIVFGVIVGILLVTHEYRYNTIMYTLAASRSRGRVLFAKFVAISAYAVVVTAFIAIFSPLMGWLGVHAAGHTLVPQTLHVGDLVWRTLFYGWGYAMAGFLLAVLTRNQIASIVALFVIPSVVEQFLGYLLLKHNSVYMPFSALNQVLNGSNGGPTGSTFSAGHAALIYCVYLVAGGIVAAVLFLKRDAN